MKHLLAATVVLMLFFALVGAAIFQSWAAFFGFACAGFGAVVAALMLTPFGD